MSFGGKDNAHMSTLWAIGAFILVLTPIILIHEFGHFLTARYFNVKVDEFGIGFPPRAATLFTHKGTVFSLNWIPLGGFVRPAGEDDPNVEGGLASASKTARFVVLFGGALFNFLAAILVFWFAYAVVGVPQFDQSRVSIATVQPGSPAEAVGLQEGDVIVSVNGETVADSMTLVQEQLAENAGQQVALTLDRAGELVSLDVRPRLPEEISPNEGAVGIILSRPELGERERQGAVAALGASVQSSWNVVYLTLSAPAMLIRGQLSAQEVRPLSPVGISQIAGRTAEATATSGDWFPLLNMIAVINVALGFTNLLPLPALDGGRIMFVLIEAIRGRRIEPEREGMVHIVGMLLLFGLMVILIVQDLVNPLF
jgi:regulator of sigma E protease